MPTPSTQPSSYPTSDPIVLPTACPSLLPTSRPSSRWDFLSIGFPSCRPSVLPFSDHSWEPILPSALPSRPSSETSPTALPSLLRPSRPSSNYPTFAPSRTSSRPTKAPSMSLVQSPSSRPSSAAPSMTAHSSARPTISAKPSRLPSIERTRLPSFAPPSPLNISLPCGKYSRFKGFPFLLSATPLGTIPEVNEIDLTSFDGVAQESFIVFGRKNDEFPGTILLSSSTRTQSLNYAALILFPSVSKKEDVRVSLVDVGDIDGDGTNDLLVGYPDAAQVVGYYQIAEDSCLHENLEASFSLHGHEGSGFGWAMDGLSDLNSDGYGDWMVSAKEEGVVYVIYGRPRDMLLGAIPVASNWTRELGFRIFRSTIETTSAFGLAVSRGGDVNKDGAMDVLVSALSVNAEGIIYVLFGKIIAAYSTEFIEDIYVDQLDGRNGVVIRAPRLSFGGISLAGVGDINSDGYADIAIGSLPYAGGFISQRTYLIFGKAIANLSASSETIYLSELSQRPGLGVLIIGGGFSVSAVGDVNQDGIVDLMVTNCLMSEGSQRYPTYFVFFPSNFSSSPTEFPSSHPFRAPTALPSSSPSSSSLENQPVAGPGNSTLQPTIPVPTSPRPSRSKPSLRPSPAPTRVPSRLPSRLPLFGSTAAPNTRGTKSKRTGPPDDNRVDPSTPSNNPTVVFNLSSLASLSRLPWTRIDCDRPGEYRASLGENTEFFVLSPGAITIVPSVSALNIIYFLPLRSQELSVVTVDQFQNTRDSINIRAFLDFQSIEDVPYSSHPLTFYLSSSQQVSLSNLQTIGDFNATASLLLYRPREEVRNNFLFQLPVLFGGVVLIVVMVFLQKLLFSESKDKPSLTSTDEEEEREFDEADDHDESLEDDDSLFLDAMFSSSVDQSSHLSSLLDSCEWSSWNLSDEDSDDIIDPDDEDDDYIDGDDDDDNYYYYYNDDDSDELKT